MKFKDLIDKHSTQSIIKMIHELYPKQRGTLGSYRKIIQIIKNTKVKNPDRTIFVEKCEIDGVIFLDTYFTKGIGKVKTLLKYYRGDTSMIVQMVKNTFNYLNKNVDIYSLVNIKANKIGSYKVDSTSVKTYGEIRVIVEVLYKMTWFKAGNEELNEQITH